MSGFVSDAGDGSQAVTLGDFVFNNWEVPEKITWGGQQRMTVHKFVGGTRWIDTMGEDNADITWSARFLSQDAASRADQLDQMRKDGQEQEFVFSGRYYKVVISSFQAQQEMMWHVPYSITLTPVSDNSAVPMTVDSTLSSVTDDFALALAFQPPLPIFGPDFILAAIVQALMIPIAIFQAINAVVHTQLFQMKAINDASNNVQNLLSQINQAATQIQATRTASDNQIQANTKQQIMIGDLAGSTSVVEATNNMQVMLAACYASATSAAVNGYVKRAQINASAGQ